MEQFKGYDPLLLADYFIQLRKPTGGLRLIQVLKLVYFAHGFHLAKTDNPLSSTPPEAWKFGPVFREIYFGLRSAPKWITKIDKYTAKHDDLSSLAKKIMNIVNKIYGGLNGWQLSALTHSEDTPWKKIYDNGKGDGLLIPDNLIREHYIEILDKKRKQLKEKHNNNG